MTGAVKTTLCTLALLLFLPMLASATIHQITVGNNFFAPTNTTIILGDTVRWTWVGGVPHSTTSDPTSPKFWDSGVWSSAGFTFDVIFTRADGFGPFPYHCAVHPTMVDTIFVATSPQNSQVNPTSVPGTDQNNASIAYSETVPGETYAIYNDFPAPGGMVPSFEYWSWSGAFGAPGTWADLIKPPDAPYTQEWNPWISALQPPVGGFVIVDAQRIGAPWAAVPNAIMANISPGGGAGFGPGVPVMASGGATWLDYPVIEVDDDPGSPFMGNAHVVWTEYLNADGIDADGNGNMFDDPGDLSVVWTASTDFAGGTGPAYPAFTAPVALLGPLPMYPNSMGSHRAALDVVGVPGNPLMGPGGVYVAWMDVVAGVILVDANPAITTGGAWGAITGGGGPAAPIGGIAPVPQVINPGIKACNTVTIACSNSPASMCAGAIYLAWADMVSGDADIMFSSSFDGGITWTPAIRINQDPLGSGLDQWAPHMRVDDATGEIVVTYYDRRNDPANTFIEVWSSNSMDCGVTWTDCLVSNAGPTPPVSNTPFPTAPYIGDYLGSDQNLLNGQAHIFNDGRNGADQDIHSSIQKFCDTDADGIVDAVDNCPFTYNPMQIDGDGDFYGAACDCNDGDMSTYPGAMEIPDDGIDQDCNGFDAVTCWVDNDLDNFGHFSSTMINPNGSCGTGWANNPLDCDDFDATVYPGAPEVPDDGIDQDCNGFDAVTCFLDADIDTYGHFVNTVIDPNGSCGTGASSNNLDCDDGDATVYPGAAEVPDDGIDQDCNGFDAVTCFVDADIDTYGHFTNTIIDPNGSCGAGASSNNLDCDDGDATVYPGAAEVPDDGIDQDCNGFDAVTCFVDADIDTYGHFTNTIIDPNGSCGTGASSNNLDCDDGDATVYPGAAEVPDDGIDQDCNGFDAVTCFVDNDLDTYGHTVNTLIDPNGSCGTGSSANNLDCDDGDASINPAGTEIPDDGIDQDCNGFDDVTCYADTDSDTYGDPNNSTVCPTGDCFCSPGLVSDSTDCDDGDPTVGPCTGCCGIYTGGYTGNTNCDTSGLMTLSDITRLIDRVYVSKAALCCEESGNTNGSVDGLITLSDITALIDQVYISKSGTAACL